MDSKRLEDIEIYKIVDRYNHERKQEKEFWKQGFKRVAVIQVIFEDENSFKEERDVRPK